LKDFHEVNPTSHLHLEFIELKDYVWDVCPLKHGSVLEEGRFVQQLTPLMEQRKEQVSILLVVVLEGCM
jgi:hypothetical protein